MNCHQSGSIPLPVETAIAMDPAITARQTLDLLLPEWQALLQAWAADGSLASAARHALELQDDPPPSLAAAPATRAAAGPRFVWQWWLGSWLWPSRREGGRAAVMAAH